MDFYGMHVYERHLYLGQGKPRPAVRRGPSCTRPWRLALAAEAQILGAGRTSAESFRLTTIIKYGPAIGTWGSHANEPPATRADARPDRSKVVRRILIPSDCAGKAVADILVSSLHSALKQFFDPLRTQDPRTDFFAIYRRESEEFDRDYVGKYDEDLNTSLIFVSHPVPVFRPRR